MAHHRAVLSDQKLINEINAVRSNFIAHTPKVEMRPVRPPVRPILTRDESRSDKTFFKGGGSKPFQKHPLPGGIPGGETLYPNPLYSGEIYQNFKRGGAMLGNKIPLTGGMHSDSDDSDSESEMSESDFEGGDLMSQSSEGEYSSDDEGEIGGSKFYDYFIKPVGKVAKHVGKEALHIGAEVGKEALKKALMALLMGGKIKGGKLSGTSEEYKHILKKIDPHLDTKKMDKTQLLKMIHRKANLGPHSDDLATLKMLNSLVKAAEAKYGQIGIGKNKGGLNGTKKELEHILMAMHPNLDLKKMSKEQIISAIKNDGGEEHFGLAPHEVEQHPIEPKKSRGRPRKEKAEPAEKKPRGRPRKEPGEPKEKKPRGRPKGSTTKKDDWFDRWLEGLDQGPPQQHDSGLTPGQMEAIEKGKGLKKTGGVIKKIVGTKRGEKVRGDIVAELMKKKGMSLGQASKYVKQQGLY